jgi:phasin family protein
MAIKKAVATPASTLVRKNIIPAQAVPAKAVPLKVTPSKMATVAAVRPKIDVETTAPARSAGTTAARTVTPSVPSGIPAKTAEIAAPTLAVPAVHEMPAETTADLVVGVPVMPADITTFQTKDKTTMENAMKSTEEFVSFGQGNVEAMMKSSQIWATGLQDLSKHFAATAQASMDETMATVKALSSVKSLKEAMEIQSSIAKTAMEKMMAESGKLTDASMKLAEQAIAPLTARVTLAAEKFGRTA